MDGKKSGNMFMAQGAGTAFQSRAAAVFGTLPSADLPKDIPDDLEKSSAPAGQSESSADVMHSGSLRKHTGETYVAPARRHEQAASGGKRRRSDHDDANDKNKLSDDFEKPPDNLSLPPPRKRRNRGYRPPDHILHPERYTKYSLEDNPAGPYAGMSEEEKNKAGVAQLFAEIRRRRQQEDEVEDEGVDKSRVVFRRAADRKTKTDAAAGESSATGDERGRANATAQSGGHAADAVLSFDTGSEEAEESALNHGQAGAAEEPATVKFSARKKFRGRRRAADDDDDEEERQ